MRFFTLAGAVTAAALLVVGCGSDSSPSGNTAGGGSGGSGGTAADTECTAPQYTDVTVSDFLSQADASKACGGESDASNVCNNDVSNAAANCGKTCLAAGSEAMQATCVEGCINQNLPSSATPFSDACLSCYSADVACAKANCLGACLTSPTSQACAQCRVEKGCAATFYDCSGLLVPTGLDLTAGSAGAGGA